MYEKFFALSHRPFAAAPNLECIVAHEGYVAARERLLRCLADGSGTAVVTASAGLGKSLLCQDVQSRLRGEFTVAYLCSAQFPNRKAMLQAILFELGAEYLGLSEDEARLCVIGAAQAAADRGRSLVIIIDEAHLVSTELLHELRAIAEPTSRCATPVRLMLCGQLELEERLADSDLDAINERIACHAILEPLTQAESAEYIHERLAMAGAKRAIFAEDSLAFIVRAADGNPRALHQLCDHCLLSAYTIEEKPVSLETARNSLDDLRSLPLHWNDAGLSDDAPQEIDDALEDDGEDEFVPTVDSADSVSAGINDATVAEQIRNEAEAIERERFWNDSPDRGVIEVGGPAAPSHPISEAALFVAVAPWPAVPVVPAAACDEPSWAIPVAPDSQQDALEVHPEMTPSISGEIFPLCEASPLEMEEEQPATAAEVFAVTAGEEAIIQEPVAAEYREEAEVDESEEDTVVEPVWTHSAEFLEVRSAADFGDEELVINDRYAALDRATEALTTYFPQAPELLQFLSQYSVNREPRRGRETASAVMHEPAIQVAEPESDIHEEELLATIRALQQQLKQASVERTDPAESWKRGVEETAYDIVEPPEAEAPAAASSVPVIEPVVEICQPVFQHAVEEAATTIVEPVRSRFAQLFSRMRQRRREVEDRLQRNADWI